MDNVQAKLAYDDGDVRLWQRRLRRKLRDLVGLSAMPRRRCPLNVRTLWRNRHDLGIIEKIAFTAEARADVTAYLCLPEGAEPPYRFMICLQGHSTGMHNSIGVDREDETKAIAVDGDRDFAIGCMRRGIAALCIEQRSFGQRRELAQKQRSGMSCQEAVTHALALGRTLIGERVYDVDRGIDYLLSRGDADRKRIGVMGNSGGGTITIFAAALLARVRFAMPSCSFCTFRDSIMSIFHCECNYVPGILRYAEMADVMGLFAPRPVVIVAGREDEIFPIKGVRKAFRSLKGIYRAAGGGSAERAGAEDHCRLVVGSEGHRFYEQQAWAEALRLL